MDETGQCIEQPYEDTVSPKPSKAGCRIAGYPVRELRRPAVGLHGSAAGAGAAGVGAVHLGERLPRDRARRRALQLVSVPGKLHRPGAFRMDARQLGRADARQRRQTAPKHLKLKFEEFDHGFIYKRVREGQSEQDRYWTVGRVALWPNGFYLGRHFEWRVPVDDENTLSVAWFFVRVPKGREPYVQNSVPTWVSPIKGDDGRWITSHVINQDIVAWVGQGAIADRTKENLRSSDIGITMMRQRFFEELEAIEAGRDPKGVIRDPEPGAVHRRCPTWRASSTPRASRSPNSRTIRCCASGSRSSATTSASRRRCAASSSRRWELPASHWRRAHVTPTPLICWQGGAGVLLISSSVMSYRRTRKQRGSSIFLFPPIRWAIASRPAPATVLIFSPTAAAALCASSEVKP